MLAVLCHTLLSFPYHVLLFPAVLAVADLRLEELELRPVIDSLRTAKVKLSTEVATLEVVRAPRPAHCEAGSTHVLQPVFHILLPLLFRPALRHHLRHFPLCQRLRRWLHLVEGGCIRNRNCPQFPTVFPQWMAIGLDGP